MFRIPKLKTRRKPICQNCRFYQDDTQHPGAGECRQKSPCGATQYQMAVWPEVFSNDWCGEFKDKPQGPYFQQS